MKRKMLTGALVALAAVLGLAILGHISAAQRRDQAYTIICANKWTGDQAPYYIFPGMADRCPSGSYRVGG